VRARLRCEQGVGRGRAAERGVGYRWLHLQARPVRLPGRAPSPATGPRRRGDGAADWEWSARRHRRAAQLHRASAASRTLPRSRDAGRAAAISSHAAPEAPAPASFLAGGGWRCTATVSTASASSCCAACPPARRGAAARELSLSARAELVVAHYLDGLPLVRDV
jgi:hypothetical protein